VSAELAVVKTKSGWAVSGGMPGYVFEARTEREMLDWISRALETRAELDKWLPSLLAARGLEPVDYRSLKPGDRYTPHLLRPLRTVSKVDHLSARASMVYHGSEPFGFTLHTSAVPAYREVTE
jgi:hypothetical protein